MTTALEIAQITVARAAQNYVRGGMSYCQQFAGNFWETHFGRPTPNSYASANAAYRASTIVSKDWNAAPPGAYHYFTYSSYGHVGVALGSGLMASGTGWGTNAVANLGKNVLVHRVADYAAHLPYLGWSYTNGARAQITGLTDANAPVVQPNQRQVKSNADARIRQGSPSTDAPYSTFHKAGSIVTPDGFVRSLIAGGATTDGNNVWFKFGPNYSHSSGFTNTGVTGLTDLGTIEPPKPVVKHVVTVKYLNDTNDVKTFEIEDGKVFTEPTAPQRDKHDFNGWAVDGVLFDFSKPITQDVTIDALWSAKPDPVEPEPEPGEPVDPAPVDPNLPTDPQEPSKPGVPAAGIIGILVAALVAVGAVLAGIFGG